MMTDWGKSNAHLASMVKAFVDMGHTTDDAIRQFEVLRDALVDQKRSENRLASRQSVVQRAGRHMSLLLDPDVTLLTMSTVAETYTLAGIARNGISVKPEWVVTLGLASSIKTKDVEVWGSSPASTYSWKISTLESRVGGSLVMHASDPPSRSMIGRMIETLAELDKDDARTHLDSRIHGVLADADSIGYDSDTGFFRRADPKDSMVYEYRAGAFTGILDPGSKVSKIINTSVS